LTYPLFSTDIIGMLLYALWLYWWGAPLERAWGTFYYARAFAAMSVISALGLALGAAVMHVPTEAANWLPLAALMVAFCLLQPYEDICIWGVVQLQSRWIAVIAALIVFFLYAEGGVPQMGFFALTGCAASYLWVRSRAWRLDNAYSTMPAGLPRAARSGRGRSRNREDGLTSRSLNPLEWVARWRRKRQFERLMRDD